MLDSKLDTPEVSGVAGILLPALDEKAQAEPGAMDASGPAIAPSTPARHPARTKRIKPQSISVYADDRHAQRLADPRRTEIAERSYNAMPELRQPGRSSSGVRNRTPLIARLSDRHAFALADMVAKHDAAERRRRGWSAREPGLTLYESVLCRWSSGNVVVWALSALLSSRGLTLPDGRQLAHDPRPEFLLWLYAGAEQYRPTVARHAARAVLYYATRLRRRLSNHQVAWIVFDALERERNTGSAIECRLRAAVDKREQIKNDTNVMPPISGTDWFCSNGMRAKYLRMRKADYLEFRNVASRVVMKAVRGAFTGYIEEARND